MCFLRNHAFAETNGHVAAKNWLAKASRLLEATSKLAPSQSGEQKVADVLMAHAFLQNQDVEGLYNSIVDKKELLYNIYI